MIRTSNRKCRQYVENRTPFKANNLEGVEHDNDTYIVLSYGWYPIVLYMNGAWYQTSDKYNQTTAKHINQTAPECAKVIDQKAMIKLHDVIKYFMI